MGNEVTINLLRTQSLLTPKELQLLTRLRFFSMILLITLLVSGFLVGSAFFAAQLRLSYLEDQRTKTSQAIAAQAKKEIYILSLKQRLPGIEKVIDNQFPWTDILTYLSDIASPPILTGLSMDNSSVITLTMSVPSLEEVELMTIKLAQLTEQKKIKKPGLRGLTLSQDKTYDVNLYFTPVY